MSYILDKRTGCHLWQGKLRDGYGVINGKAAHRVVYMDTAAIILPEGVFLDHLCRRRSCIRFQHLEPVTNAENMRRVSARNRRKMKYCPEGHTLAETGISTEEGGMVCAICSGVPLP